MVKLICICCICCRPTALLNCRQQKRRVFLPAHPCPYPSRYVWKFFHCACCCLPNLPHCFQTANCRHQKRLVFLRLQRIGLGTWQSDGISKRLRTAEPGLELYRTKTTRGGRIIWQVIVHGCVFVIMCMLDIVYV